MCIKRIINRRVMTGRDTNGCGHSVDERSSSSAMNSRRCSKQKITTKHDRLKAKTNS